MAARKRQRPMQLGAMFSFRMPDEWHRRLEEIADERVGSVSELVREAVRRYLNSYHDET